MEDSVPSIVLRAVHPHAIRLHPAFGDCGSLYNPAHKLMGFLKIPKCLYSKLALFPPGDRLYNNQHINCYPHPTPEHPPLLPISLAIVVM